MSDLAFPLRLSLQVAATATALTAVIGVTLAYVLARFRFRGREALDMLVTMPMVLPPVVTGCFLLLLVGRNGPLAGALRAATGAEFSVTFTWHAAVLAAFVVSLPLTVKTARAAIESVDPALIEASHTLGRGELATALHVVLPLARRGIAAGLVLSFARALGEFGATIVVAGNIPGRTDTMPLRIYTAVVDGDWSSAWPLALAFAAVSAAFMLLAGRLARGRLL